MTLTFTFSVLLFGHESEDGFGVLVRLLLTGSSRVFSVVGQLARAAHVADGIPVAKYHSYSTVK